MRNTITALLGAAALVVGATPAMAQTKYFARERIVGMSAAVVPPFSPVYGPKYTACIGGTQTASKTSCRKADGTTANLSDCSSYPQTTSRSCSLTCTTYTRAYASDNVTKRSTQTSAANATAACKAITDAEGPGTCSWNGTASAYDTGYQKLDVNGLYISMGRTGVSTSTGFPANMIAISCQEP